MGEKTFAPKTPAPGCVRSDCPSCPPLVLHWADSTLAVRMRGGIGPRPSLFEIGSCVSWELRGAGYCARGRPPLSTCTNIAHEITSVVGNAGPTLQLGSLSRQDPRAATPGLPQP